MCNLVKIMCNKEPSKALGSTFSPRIPSCSPARHQKMGHKPRGCCPGKS